MYRKQFAGMMPVGAFHLAGLSGLQQLGRHSTRVSKLGSKKKGIEYLSAEPSVMTLCTVDLKRPLVHLCTSQCSALYLPLLSNL